MRSYFKCFQAFKDISPPSQAFVVQLYWNAEHAAADNAQVFDGIPSNIWVDMPSKQNFMQMMNVIAQNLNLVEWELGQHNPLLAIYLTRPSEN